MRKTIALIFPRIFGRAVLYDSEQVFYVTRYREVYNCLRLFYRRGDHAYVRIAIAIAAKLSVLDSLGGSSDMRAYIIQRERQYTTLAIGFRRCGVLYELQRQNGSAGTNSASRACSHRALVYMYTLTIRGKVRNGEFRPVKRSSSCKRVLYRERIYISSAVIRG